MTQVTQTPPPFKPSSIVREGVSFGTQAMGEYPPSYAMMPLDMQADAYQLSESSAMGVVRKSPWQNGIWCLYPVYYHAIPFIYDSATGALWSRSLNPLQNDSWNVKQIQETMRRMTIPTEHRWLHCIRIRTDEANYLKYTIIVLDFIHPTLICAARRSALKSTFSELGIRTQPVNGAVHLIPEFPERIGSELWVNLHRMNQVWGRPFYSGLLARCQSSPYSMQKSDPNKPSARWHFHKFDDTTFLDADANPKT